MQELAIDVRQYGEIEGIADNIRYSLSLGLPEFTPSLVKHDGTILICGSGPSIKNQVEGIRERHEAGKPIIAVNGAHDFLLENGITPDIFLTVDPRGMPQNLKHRNDETVYLLASRVNIEDFKLLEGKKRILFHSWSEDDDGLIPDGKIKVGGGSTSGLRAVNIAYLMGFRNVDMFGMDSCLGEKGEKRIGEDPLPDNVTKTNVIVGGREFICNIAMAAQAQDFQNIYEVMPDIHIEVHGGGLLAAIIEERKKQGFSA